eukprot:4440705-Amphidinium_carterae.1
MALADHCTPSWLAWHGCFAVVSWLLCVGTWEDVKFFWDEVAQRVSYRLGHPRRMQAVARLLGP